LAAIESVFCVRIPFFEPLGGNLAVPVPEDHFAHVAGAVDKLARAVVGIRDPRNDTESIASDSGLVLRFFFVFLFLGFGRSGYCFGETLYGDVKQRVMGVFCSASAKPLRRLGVLGSLV